MRWALVALASGVLLATVAATARSDAPEPALPAWIPPQIGGFVIGELVAGDVRIGREAAIEAVRSAVFLGEGPGPDPDAFPVRVDGPIGHDPAASSGQTLDLVVSAPAWLVVWRGLPGGTLERFGEWLDDEPVDAVFLVDGQTADCCWLTRFLTGAARLR
jgi:hypothetical protein